MAKKKPAVENSDVPEVLVPADANAVLVEPSIGDVYEAVADDPVDPNGQTLFIYISGQRFEHCATRADGRWIYRKS